MHAALVADVLQRAERRLGEPSQAGAGECSSPPCMMHEFDPAYVERSKQASAPAQLSTIDPAQEWEEVRLWRKAKRMVLIERRLAMPDAERRADRLLLAVQGRVRPATLDSVPARQWDTAGPTGGRRKSRARDLS